MCGGEGGTTWAKSTTTKNKEEPPKETGLLVWTDAGNKDISLDMYIWCGFGDEGGWPPGGPGAPVAQLP